MPGAWSADFSVDFGSGTSVLTANIHIGLAGWSNATYAVGQRRSNAGNAYQCTVAGTSTVPPTGVLPDTAPGGTAHWKWLSAVDYTSLQAFNDGTAGTLTQPLVGLVWDNANPTLVATLGTPLLVVDGHITTALNNITIQPAPGEGFQDVFAAAPTTALAYNGANGVAIELPSAAATPTPTGFSATDTVGFTVSGTGSPTTTNPTTGGSIRSNTSHTVGLLYFEATISGTINSNSPFIGIATAAYNEFSILGGDAVSVGFRPGDISEISYNNVWRGGSTPGPMLTGQTVSVCVDLNNGFIYYLSPQFITAQGAAGWNGFPSSDPVLGVHGVAFSFAGAAAFFAVSASTAGAIVTINSGQSAFLRTPPAGYVAWDNWAGITGMPYIQVNDNFVTFRGIQFRDPVPASISAIIVAGSANTNTVVDQCIVDGYPQSSGSMIQLGTNSVITNSVLVDRGSGSNATAQMFTGGVAANNTFVRFTAPTGAIALNAGGAPGSGTVKSVNNIFVNYDHVHVNSSGTPWTTNHNAYTGALFFSTNGTDTGGSIFSIVPASVFVNAATDFHVQTGAAVLNVGLTDTADIPKSTDIFNVARPQGTNWDIGAHELLAGLSVLRDFVASIDYKGSLTIDRVFPVEKTTGQLGPPVNMSAAIEWKSSIVENSAAPVDWRFAFSSDTVSNAEWVSSVRLVQADGAVPVEWRGGILRDDAPPVSFYGSLQVDAPAPTDWAAQKIYSVTAPVEFITSFAGLSAVVPIEFGISVRRDTPTTLAPLVTTALTQSAPVEWGGLTTLIFDRPVPVDWAASLAPVVAAAVEWGLSAVATATLPVEWLLTSGIARNVSVGVDWASQTGVSALVNTDYTASLTVTGQVNLEASLSTIATATVTTEYNLVVRLDRTIAVEPASLINRADNWALDVEMLRIGTVTMPLETGGSTAAGIPADAAISLEWRGGIVRDTLVNTEIGGSIYRDVTVVYAVGAQFIHDDAVGAVWTSQILRDALMPVDWLQNTKAVTVDATITLEFGRTVIRDDASALQVGLGRESIGAKLEPDEWETEHEP